MVSVLAFLKKVKDLTVEFLKDKDTASIVTGLFVGFVVGFAVCLVF